VTRQAGPRTLARREEITEFNPSRSWVVCGVGGPVTAIAKGTVEPLADGAGSRVTIALDFGGHGIGKLLVLLVIRKQARKQLPRNMQKLKEQLEQPGSS
jgi:hypothetical protein